MLRAKTLIVYSSNEANLSKRGRPPAGNKFGGQLMRIVGTPGEGIYQKVGETARKESEVDEEEEIMTMK